MDIRMLGVASSCNVLWTKYLSLYICSFNVYVDLTNKIEPDI